MKKIIFSIVILVLSSKAYAHVEHYKNLSYLEYELYRNDQSIGHHKYYFSKIDDKLSIKSVVNFKIKKLNIELYNYFAESEEIYKNNEFFKFISNTNQNKKKKYVKILVDDAKNQLLIDGSSYKGPADIKTIIGTWWNHEILKADAQISAISGRIIEQEVTFLGKEEIEIDGKKYKSIKFNFKSSDESLPDNKKLNTNIWYEEGTYLWLKASFEKTGFWEYRLKKVEYGK